MIDRVDLYTLLNNLYHLFITEEDLITIKKLITEKDFKGIDKLDILYIITMAIRPIENEYSDLEINTKCSDIVDKIIPISNFNYTEDEVYKIKLFYYYLYKKIPEKSALFEAIETLNNIIINNTNQLSPLIKYINEELRIILLEYYQHSDNIYDSNITNIENHLQLAKQNKQFRLEIASILRNG